MFWDGEFLVIFMKMSEGMKNGFKMQVASGYAGGSIRIWDCDKGSCETTLNGHKGAVTSLRYNKVGSPLASGSKDNDVIL